MLPSSIVSVPVRAVDTFAASVTDGCGSERMDEARDFRSGIIHHDDVQRSIRLDMDWRFARFGDGWIGRPSKTKSVP
jgi:hypothetical protein